MKEEEEKKRRDSAIIDYQPPMGNPQNDLSYLGLPSMESTPNSYRQSSMPNQPSMSKQSGMPKQANTSYSIDLGSFVAGAMYMKGIQDGMKLTKLLGEGAKQSDVYKASPKMLGSLYKGDKAGYRSPRGSLANRAGYRGASAGRSIGYAGKASAGKGSK